MIDLVHSSALALDNIKESANIEFNIYIDALSNFQNELVGDKVCVKSIQNVFVIKLVFLYFWKSGFPSIYDVNLSHGLLRV